MKYTLDGETFYEGQPMPNGEGWNGFDLPMFTESVCADILNNEGVEFSFVDNRLTVYINPADRNETEVYQMLPGGFYALGAFSWTWELVKETA